MGFIVFYADWCGHCKNMVSEYNKLAKLLEKCIKSGAVFTNVFNCNNPGLYKEVAQQYGVQGYPTIKFINFEGEMIPYDGGREVNDFLNFFTNQMPKLCECYGKCRN
jgi:protein disulfide-isomerase A6